jgi:hypothetical protein
MPPSEVLHSTREDEHDFEREEPFEDDGPTDVMTLIVLDEMPHDVGTTYEVTPIRD